MEGEIMLNRDYYLGLDIGTSSVGWAVTDTDYNLLRAKGKDLWGVRLFSEASTAADRRIKRIARRRNEREKARKAMLKELFSDEINKVDPGFYHRMEESFLWQDDRSEDNQQKFTLFNDRNFTDRDYFKKYPTIFHLRQALLHEAGPFDVRLIFLAIYNMFGHRGHFLNATLDPTKEDLRLDPAYAEMEAAFADCDIALPKIGDQGWAFDLFESKLSQTGKSRTMICEDVASALSITQKDKAAYAVIKLICGRSVPIKGFVSGDILSKEAAVSKICFRSASFEEDMEKIKAFLEERWITAIEAAKAVHDGGLLANILHGATYLSDARVAIYDKHHRDLVRLKRLLRKYDLKDEYHQLFRSAEDSTYSAYVGSVNYHGKARRVGKVRSKDALYKTIEDALKRIPESDPERLVIEASINSEDFLEKQLTGSNGVIPNQVHSRELRQILSNAERYLPFLTERDERQLSISEKIIQLFEFQIPYYVGPLGKAFNGKPGYNVWACHKSAGRILPWNFSDRIDEAASAERFIERMLRKCTYLSDEATLPKQSLLYEKFMVLNEINNIRVDGVRLDTETKQNLYHDLFLGGKRVTRKQIQAYLVNHNITAPESEITGVDIQCNQSLTTLGKFIGVFGDRVYTDEIASFIEDVVFWKTVFGEDKRFVRAKIEQNYPNLLSDAQLNRILGFKFTGWGRLSRNFLEMEGTSKLTGEIKSIINFLWDEQVNLMELLSDHYTFTDQLNQRLNQLEKPLSEWTIEDLDDLYLSPAVKRMIWQTMKIVDELQQVLGHAPRRVFVEMVRGEGEKKRTTSRKEKVKQLYKSIDDEAGIWRNQLSDRPESDFKRKKLYLYALQQGRCMYTGEPIDIHDLMNDNLYDIDHIYPQHFIKDDSLESNLVLVKKQTNAQKGDRPLTHEIQHAQRGFWKGLVDKGFISREKYLRLTRRDLAFTQEEKLGFINRQLVETGQATKVITQILQGALGKDTAIIFSKARLVSDFRHSFDIPKVREINDLHHANDAYLNIVVGNSYYVKFTNNPARFLSDAEKNPTKEEYRYHLSKFFNFDIRSGRETAWIASKKDGEEFGTIVTVRRTLKRHSPLVTKKTEEGHGEFFNETIYSVQDESKANGYIGIKTKNSPLADVMRYGGKTSVSTMGYALLDYEKRGKHFKLLEALPSILGERRAITEEMILNHVKNSTMLKEAPAVKQSLRVCLPFIPLQTMIRRNGYTYYLGGKTQKQHYLYNAVQVALDDRWVRYLKKMVKAKKASDYGETDSAGHPILTSDRNIAFFKLIIDRLERPPFSHRNNNIAEKLRLGLNRFEALELPKQVELLLGIIANWSKMEKVDLTGLKRAGENDKSFTPSAGIVRGASTIKEDETAVLIYQSVTGLYRIERDIMTL